ncbi:hypothetical protein [Actinoplanes sp. CA-252034]|uniref:hypothetical protein n=1 Tax=Actinoplanes sp. CA-252034 TaxID=3239906 RepID=UPI003D9892D3
MIHEDEVEPPVPGTGEVLLRVAATTFNPSETGLRRGLLRSIVPVELPYTGPARSAASPRSWPGTRARTSPSSRGRTARRRSGRSTPTSTWSRPLPGTPG